MSDRAAVNCESRDLNPDPLRDWILSLRSTLNDAKRYEEKTGNRGVSRSSGLSQVEQICVGLEGYWKVENSGRSLAPMFIARSHAHAPKILLTI